MATSSTKINIVVGTVTNDNNRPLANLKVEIFDVDMRNWQLLADTVTNRAGKYELGWKLSQLKGREIKTADIGVRVSTVEKDTELFKSNMEQVRFNAGEREEINIIIKQNLPVENIEFDTLVKEVRFLAEKVAIENLQENQSYNDITFLSNELDTPADKLEHLVVSHRLQKISKIDAAFFYALLRKNTLLNNDFGTSLQAQLSIGIGSDDQILLFNAALADQKKIDADVKIAVEEMLVSNKVVKNIKEYLKILSRYKKKAEAYYKNEQPKKVVALLTSMLNPAKISEVKQLFLDNKNDLNNFFEKITDPAFLDTKANNKVNDIVSSIFNFGKAAVPNIIKENNVKKMEDVRRLARFNKKKWVEVIKKSNPKLKDKSVINTYASIIVRNFEKTYPTTAFAAQLERSSKTVLNNQKDVVNFFNKYEDFNLQKNNVDLFLKDKKVAAKDAELVSNELKSVQRIFKLIPHYGKTIALHNEKIHSAFNIVSIGKNRFINEVASKAGLTTAEAKDVYQKAEVKNTAAMLMIGDLNESISSLNIASLKNASLANKIEAVSKDFPNLKSLFKLTDVCECEHCRSVYSPAAYLVEILQFLDKRTVAAGNAKTVLFNRRPDLGEIDLGCENAETPVKYIDLVCEILEDAVAPDAGINYTGNLSVGPDPLKGKISANLLNILTGAGMPVTAQAQIYETETGMVSAATLPHYLRDTKLVCKIINTGGSNYNIFRLRQTMSSAEELDAAPEYVNTDAYDALRNQKYAFKLPFDLPNAEAKAYFERFGLNRYELMKSFQLAAGPSDDAIAAESLGLTDIERQIITAPPAPNNNSAQQAFWNVPAPGNVVDYLKQVDHFLDRTGLEYKDLELLLKLKFINQNKNLFIYNSDLSCDTSKKEIKNIDFEVLDHIHRFLRLQKKTGWQLELLDEIISQRNLGNGSLDNNCLKVAADLKKLSNESGLKIEELICFYGEIPHTLLPYKTTTIYESIFQNIAKNGSVEPGLSIENVTANEAAAVKKQLADFKTPISVCINIKESDFDKLAAVLPNTDLTFANLSGMYAMGKFMKKLKIKTDDFFILKELTGIDVFNSTAETVEFYKAINDADQLPIMPADVKFMLNHEADNLSDREIKTEKIDSLLAELQAAYQKSFNDNRSLFNNDLSAEAQKETLKSQLMVLKILTETDVSIILNFVDRKWKYSWVDENFVQHSGTNPVDAITFIDDKKISTLFDVANIKNTLNTLAAAPGPSIESEQKTFIKAWLDAISAYNYKTEKPALLSTTLSNSFKTDTDTIAVVLANAKLKKIAPGTDLLLDLLLSDSLIDTAGITTIHPLPVLPVINEAALSKQYAAIRLLHKLFPLINSFKMDNVQLEWFFKNNNQLGWFEFDNIPFVSAQVIIPYKSFLKFAEIFSLSKSLYPVINPSDIENPVTFFSVMELVLAPATTLDELMNAISILTGYEKDNLTAADSYFFAGFNLNNYKVIDNIMRLLECVEDMRKLSANVTQITNYIKPVLDAADVADLRTNLKSRYDEDIWLSTLKEIMDKIRPQKRDALVTYLLAVNPDIKDENDLYEYFLVDVEMGSCMPSSRIVLAHNSVQLFVQRCLMGLEPDAIADTDNDPNWNQWAWMKNYRIWEANRKIFLYPADWYDITLIDDKSFLLSEFINELQQNELTNDTAEASIRNYFEKLDNISFLEVMATWYDVPTRIMHVFARTKGGDPAIYYYRRFEKERLWTPWEKVELDISGDHLLAFIRNDRLNLAWPVFSEENDPDQGTTLPDQSRTDEQPVSKPRKKLKIQLAISEFSNSKWQPKKVSKDAISMPPSGYITAEISRDEFQFFYNETAAQIILYRIPEGYLNSYNGSETVYYLNQVGGAFNITGCKGYPEVAPVMPYNLNFIPKFLDTELMNQRYNELPSNIDNDLSVMNIDSLFSGKNYNKILSITPGIFRISYPIQFTIIDLLAFLFEWFIYFLQRNFKYDKRFIPSLPVGTLLPYFMEDSWHAYVIIPGFYNAEYSGGEFPSITGLNDDDKRTASDVFQLIDDIINWIKKIQLEFQTNPPADVKSAINTILTDPDFQSISLEMSRYNALRPLLQMLLGNTSNNDFNEQLKIALEKAGLIYGEQFKNLYHPLVCELRKALYSDKGVSELMKRETQLQTNKNFDFKAYYNPNELYVAELSYKQPDGTLTRNYPIEDIDFTSDGSYSLYNWDIFFRMPFHIAGSLMQYQRFEDALTWFHYIFNPTGALPGTGVQKYWVTKPFYLNQETDYITQRIDSIMYAAADKTNPDIKDLEFAIDEWRSKPFRPDIVAKFRPVAYQKAVLMKYIDNLTEWGDYLFRQDTMESVAQATQMYILADKLLGPKPRIVPPVVKSPYETYNQIEAKLDSFGNALIALENILPDLSVLPEGGAEFPPPPITLSMLYFCIPPDEKMFEYWDLVADRLFKLRNCQNIDGIERTLALFAPPIDPGLLVKAAASGLDISSIIAGLNAPTPFYRFNAISQKATELAQEVRGLGNSLLQALEKKDAEALALLRNELELKVLNLVKDLKKLQVDEANEQIEILYRTQKVTEERYNYYKNIQKIIPKEQLNLDKLGEANSYQVAAQIVRTVAGALRLVPEFHVGASGFGGSPHVVMQLGGSAMSGAANIAADILGILSSISSYEANRASILGGYDRRFDDWKLQERLAQKELDSIQSQITAAEIRKEISETDLKNQELQIENSQKTDEFMRSKFTNKELYDWMIGQISSVYFKSYQLAHDFAVKAERCYRFELGNNDSFISYGYWDSMKKGLQSADNLIHDIKRMETSYLDKNSREKEIIRNVSLVQLDPLALIKLRNTGVCDFEIPEAFFDIDYAGFYFRRIKSVSISLPCIVGPYTAVSAKLSLINNRYRKNINSDNAAATGYPEDPGNDERFTYNVGSIQSIATSNAQNDSGLFELNFRDERYLPFEGCGAISSWRLELPNPAVAKPFNYETIADVILNIKYTARDGGSTLKGLAESSLRERLANIKQQVNSETGIHIAINMKHEMPNEWHLLKKNKTVDITISDDRLPYFIQAIGGEDIDHIKFIAESPAAITLKIDNTPLAVNGTLWGLFNGNTSSGEVSLNTAFTLSIDSQTELDSLENLMMIIKCAF